MINNIYEVALKEQYNSIGLEKFLKMVSSQMNLSELTSISEEEYEAVVEGGINEGDIFFNEMVKKWQVVFSLSQSTETTKRKLLTAMTEEKLLEKYNTYITNGIAAPIQRKVSTLGGNKTLEDVYNEYLFTIMGNGSSRAFVDKVARSEKVIYYIGALKMEDINEVSLSGFINKLPSMTYTNKNSTVFYGHQTIHKYFIELHCVIKYAQRQKYISEDFMTSIRKPQIQRIQEPKHKALPEEKIREVINATEKFPMWKALVYIELNCGLRPGEAHALKFSDFDYEQNIVHINKALSEEITIDMKTKKRTKVVPIIKSLKNEYNGNNEDAHRTLHINIKTTEAILEYREWINRNSKLVDKRKFYGTDDFLFTKSNGQLPTSTYMPKKYANFLKDVGLSQSEFSQYNFRHTFCTRLFLKGLSPKQVAKLMGDNDTTMIMKVYNTINKQDTLKTSSEFSNEMGNLLI